MHEDAHPAEITGSCLCGKINYRFNTAGMRFINNCHCRNCQKQSGAAFVSSLHVDPDVFAWLDGEELIKHYASSPEVQRAFCADCGSRVPQQQPDDVVVPMAGLDEPLNLAPQVDIWADQKLPWLTIDPARPACRGRGTPEFWAKLMGGDVETYRTLQQELDERQNQLRRSATHNSQPKEQGQL